MPLVSVGSLLYLQFNSFSAVQHPSLKVFLLFVHLSQKAEQASLHPISQKCRCVFFVGASLASACCEFAEILEFQGLV